MKYARASILALLTLSTLVSCSQEAARPAAETVLVSGQIHTIDADRRTVQAMALADGKIIAVGSNDDMLPFIADATEVIDLGGKLVLPGFIDSHAHAVSATKQLYEVNLNNLHSAAEIQAALREFRAVHPDAGMIKGRGWSNADFGPGGPDKKIIDAVISDIPVSLIDDSGHAGWVNSKAFELAGVDATTPEPDDGVVERYASGEPSGTLREGAKGLVSDLFPYYGYEELKNGILAYQEMALAFGITSVNEAYLDLGIDEVPAYLGLQAEDRLQMRFRAGLYVDPDMGTEQVPALIEERSKSSGKLFKINSAKIFIDGVVEGGTAYLDEPYLHMPESRGKLLWDLDRLNAVAAELDRQGFQIHVHAIGDGAVRVTLDALDHVRQQNGVRDSRHGLTHIQLVSRQDIQRFKDLGVVAVPQPYWFKKDSYYYNVQVPFLGQQRADEEYPMASFFRAGVTVASSSDYPVTIPCNPLLAIETGITRREIGNTEPDGALWPAESATLA